MSRIFLSGLLWWCAALTPLSLAACNPDPAISSGANTVVSGAADIGGPFSLIDHNGNPVTDADFNGKPLLIYFGFAYCPDICPTSLQKLGAALDMTGDLADGFQPILITVDPERDTPAQLALYVKANGFPKNLIGLTGSQEQIEIAKKAYSAIGEKVEDPESVGGVTFDHTNFIYLMDRDGKFVDIFSGSDTPREIADQLIAYKKTEP